MKAVVMAGGEGSRLRPLTSRRPKPLAPIVNKPVMHHIVDLLRRHGITDIIATLHYLADEIESYFGDGSDFGVSMQYVVEDTPLGTAGAVKQAHELIGNETFLIISGDALTDLDLGKLLAHHRESGAVATITLQRVPNPLEFGVVVTDENGRIERFLEKPSWGEIFSDTINTGIYVLEPSVLDTMVAGRNYDFSKDIFPRILHEGRPINGYITEDYWTDIGNLQQYQQANYDALEGRVRIEIDGVETAPGIWLGEGAHVHADAKLHGPVVLGRNVAVERGATVGPLTTIDDSGIIATDATVHHTVAWENVYIGQSASVDGATVADHNTIKDHVRVGEGVVIGARCVIGSNAIIRPHIKIWPEKSISSGGIVSMSLIYGIKWPGSLFGAVGVSGLANVEITPEFAMKLGQAFGSFLRPGNVCMTSRDTHPASRIMNRCIISGLLSVGVNVEDLRSYPLPLSRYAVRVGGDGGVHCRLSPDDPNAFLIEFFDKNGVNVDKNTERKIENLFFREDFRATGMDNVGHLDFPSRLLERYTNAYMAALNPHALPNAKFRVVLDYAHGNASLVMPRLLSNLGIDMIALNAYFDDAKLRTFRQDREKHIEQLRNIVESLDANFGVLFDHDGETLAFIDERGRVVAGNRLFALATLLVARAKPNARIAVPITTPMVIEEIAEKYGATVIRTRSDRRATMALAETEGAALDFAGGANHEVIFPEFQPAFDGLYASAKIMELLAAENRTMGELVDMLPSWHIATRRVPCPWERKGEIMRTLFDEQRNENVELIDGIRLFRNGGWVLILPDASDPQFNVYAEGGTDAEARDYVDEFAHRIEDLVNTYVAS